MPALRATGVEQEIVKVPKNQIVIALVGPEAAAPRIDLEEDLAIDQQGEKLSSWKNSPLAELFDFLRRREERNCGRKFRVANFEQRASARRFQHHLIAATA